jgi:type II secretory ATPase GspE/PulE/Tfp pilus assembly ATPase PilB-like protein
MKIEPHANPQENYENILNRIKVNARLRIDEHVSAQDGAMRFAGEGGVVTDIRVSIVPTIEGEKIALRILSHYIENLTLSDLGLGEASEKKIKDAADKPFGMILVVGPTGAGKTTTLYAVLKRLNQPDVNITTIEDPVEYRMQGVNQIQVNADTHLTFAEGLRSIVRQDPDIILVGEIRDKETAEISVNAALTGHLLLSTFHANDASSALPRLVEMDIEPFLLASTLEVVVAQRLARRLCQNCRYSTSVARTSIEKEFPFLKKYWKGNKVTLYKSHGCKACGNTGYTGRVGIFEFISITPAMEELILKHPNAAEIRALAKKEGTVFMFEDGMDKVKNGITTIEEVVRVVGMPE